MTAIAVSNIVRAPLFDLDTKSTGEINVRILFGNQSFSPPINEKFNLQTATMN